MPQPRTNSIIITTTTNTSDIPPATGGRRLLISEFSKPFDTLEVSNA